MPFLGETLVLAIQMQNGASNVFPRARLYDSTGTEISGSPVNLTHIALGLYFNINLVMPNTRFLTVQYKIYSDSGHTTLSTTNGDAVETFELDTKDAGNALIGLLEANNILQASVDDSEAMIGIINQNNELEGEDC